MKDIPWDFIRFLLKHLHMTNFLLIISTLLVKSKRKRRLFTDVSKIESKKYIKYFC